MKPFQRFCVDKLNRFSGLGHLPNPAYKLDIFFVIIWTAFQIER